MKKLWLKKSILTLGLTLGFAAVASAQTTGDARCADSRAGNYWMAVTQNSGYCTSPPAQTSTKSACADKEPGGPWLQCVLQEHATEIAAAKAAAQSASAQRSNWLDAACPNKEPDEAWRQCVMAAVSAKAEARENTFDEQMAQQKLQQQQAEYQRQELQQAELARRQIVLRHLMNRPSYTPAPSAYNPSVVAPFYINLNNNNIQCTPQRLGDTSYTNCY